MLFAGQLHNRREIASELGTIDCHSADVYATALEHWGDQADERCIGHYAAIAVFPDGQALRISRSPFQAMPLHFRHDGSVASAMPLPRALFWREQGRPEPDLERAAQTLLNDHSDWHRSWYRGAHRVPLGCAIELAPGGWREVWRYDLFSRPTVRFKRPEDYVEAAVALLDQGVAAALDNSRKPAVLLSGGLDSGLVAASTLRLRQEAALHAYTFGPEDDWSQNAPSGTFLSDFPAVRQFAAANPRVVLTCETNPGRDLRYRQRDLLEAMEAAPSMLGLAWVEQALFESARDDGCDVMLCGTWGNHTFSSKAPWAYSEFLRRSRWGELRAALRSRQGDPRPIWHRFAALAVLPQLPRPLWQALHYLRARAAGSPTAVSPHWPGLAEALERSRKAGFDFERLQFASQRAHWRSLMSEDGQEQDLYAHGMELLHGLPKRDPTAYRPLVEFCYGCPTDIFMRGGEDRWLAREMGRGRLPEAQRTDRGYGQQYVDWQPRLARARGDLLAEIDLMWNDADIAAVVDLPRIKRLLEDLPELHSHYDPQVALPYQTVLPLGLAAGRFIAWAKGRNDL